MLGMLQMTCVDQYERVAGLNFITVDLNVSFLIEFNAIGNLSKLNLSDIYH